jgi:hypothetical protein
MNSRRKLENNHAIVRINNIMSQTFVPNPNNFTGLHFENNSVWGNIAIVDQQFGNDTTGYVGGIHFATIEAALLSVSPGQCVYILPGVYVINEELIIPDNISVIGLSYNNCIIEYYSSESTVMVTMGEYSIVENVTFKLFSTSATADLIGILFDGTTTVTSSISKTSIIINNSSIERTTDTNVYGVQAVGVNDVITNKNNCLIFCHIQITSNGLGKKRGIIMNSSCAMLVRDSTIVIDIPTDELSEGSYVGIETDDVNELASIQLRMTTVSSCQGRVSGSYTSSDILQTTPTNIVNTQYQSFPGIQLGPETSLITKTAGGLGFSTYIYPTIIYYGLKGNIRSAPSGGYLWPGTQAISAGTFPDTGTPYAFFRIQQPCLLCGISASLNIPCTTGSLTLIVKKTPVASVPNGSSIDTIFTITFSGEIVDLSFYNGSVAFDVGDRLHLYCSYTGNVSAHDITCQLDLF